MTHAELNRAYALMTGILSDVCGQVQFGEAKNGAFFATTMDVVVGVSAVLADEHAALAPIAMCVGAMRARPLWRFLPAMENNRHRYSAGSGGGDDLLL